MIEIKSLLQYPQDIIALDEVGRSPLSGPVVIGAVKLSVTDPKLLISLLRFLKRKGIKDSKLLTSEDRLKILFDLGISQNDFRHLGEVRLKGFAIKFVTWEMDHFVIDTENILAASLRGMKEAALFLSEENKSQTTLLIDGPFKLRWENASPFREVPIIKGDIKSPLIALAAIIAKEKRDHLMREMHHLYPQYGFNTNVGYPTRAHRMAIALHGPCPIHRRSFNKVKEFLPEKD
jgi:ribonuclease HII